MGNVINHVCTVMKNWRIKYSDLSHFNNQDYNN